jgi:hypothetical protein
MLSRCKTVVAEMVPETFLEKQGPNGTPAATRYSVWRHPHLREGLASWQV